MALDKFLLRTVVGGLMVGHGLQKLNGSFGGPGLDGTEKSMKAVGMNPPDLQARAVALSETIGGGLTALGLFSPLGPAMVMGTMVVAIKKVHLKNGLWNSHKGYEFNLTLIAASFSLAADGPGLLSVDWLLGKQRSGLKWALAAATLGAGAAAGALRLGGQPPSPLESDGLTEDPTPVTVTSARYEKPTRPAADLSGPDHHSEQRHSGNDQSGHDHSGHDQSGHEHSGHEDSEHQHPDHQPSGADGS